MNQRAFFSTTPVETAFVGQRLGEIEDRCNQSHVAMVAYTTDVREETYMYLLLNLR